MMYDNWIILWHVVLSVVIWTGEIWITSLFTHLFSRDVFLANNACCDNERKHGLLRLYLRISSHGTSFRERLASYSFRLQLVSFSCDGKGFTHFLVKPPQPSTSYTMTGTKPCSGCGLCEATGQRTMLIHSPLPWVALQESLHNVNMWKMWCVHVSYSVTHT